MLGVKKWECTVVSNRNISTFLKEFVVKLPEGENLQIPQRRLHPDRHPEIRCHQVLGHGRRRGLPCRLGQVQDVGSGYDQPRGYVPCLSMANHPAEGNIIMLNIRIATPPFDKATGGS